MGEDGRDRSELEADQVAQRLRELGGEVVVLEEVQGAEDKGDNALGHERVVWVPEELALLASVRAPEKQRGEGRGGEGGHRG